MSTRSRLRLPKEHGAWAMLYVPFAVGALVASEVSLPVLFLLVAVTSFFIARESVLAWWRARSRGSEDCEARRFMLFYLALSASFGIPLIILYHLFWLLLFAVVAAALLVVNSQQAIRREDRSISGEMIAIAGLTLTAPAAYYVSRGTLDVTALWLWALCALYFASSIFYVKLRVNTINPRREAAKRQSWKQCAAYHSLLLAALLILAIAGSISSFALIAFLPVLSRSFWHLARPVRQINLRRVGWLEVVYSAVFLTFTLLTFRA